MVWQRRLYYCFRKVLWGSQRKFETLSTDYKCKQPVLDLLLPPSGSVKKDGYRCEINIDPDYLSKFNSRGERDDDGFLEN